VNNTFDPHSRSTLISVGIGLAIVALAGWYLLGWKELPLYPDEIALRLKSARVLADGFVAYPTFPQCSSSPMALPWPLVPASLVMAFWDSTFGWSFVRLVPCLIVLLATATVAIHVQRRGPRLATGLLPIAFLGAAGSGLAMMRMESFQLLQAIACMVAYMVLNSRRASGVEFLAQILLAMASLLSIFVHPQGLIFIPVAVLLAGAIGVTSTHFVGRLTSIVVVALLMAGTYGVVGKIERPCASAPAIMRALQEKTLLGQDQAEPFFQGITPWVNKLDVYAKNFTYNAAYPVNHLPGLSDADIQRRYVKSVNFAIYWISILNIFLAICTTLFAGALAIRSLLSREDDLLSRLSLVLRNGYVYVFMVGVSHILYFIYDTEGAFYRAYYFNFIFTIINTIALSHFLGKRQLLLLPAVAVAVGLLFISTNLDARYFQAEFASGWTGPSLSVDTDWNATSKAVNALADSCGIPDDGTDLIVDDLTFSALRSHRHLIPFTYVMLGDYYNGNEPNNQGLVSRLGKLGTAAIMQCGAFAGGLTNDAVRSGGLCCVKFQLK
jgi:hypothetical protein